MRINKAKAYISLGSNLGDREKNLITAVHKLRELENSCLGGVSSLYLTAPQGYSEQGEFLNAVVEFQTLLEPIVLLRELQNIESELGRVRLERWGPRTIDLDILLYEDLKLDYPELTLPHPRLEERAFVLEPLAEISPGLLLQGGKVEEVRKKVKNQKISLFKRNWFDTL